MKERDYLFDNIKAVLLFLVAFGHVLDVFIDDGKNVIFYTVMKWIYLFHMPLFAFITGYFTKDFDKARENAVRKILIPYLFFQSIYVLVALLMIRLGLASFNLDVFNSSIILPSSAFYYLLAVFIWKLTAKDMMKVRFPILTAWILGIVISFTKYGDFHCGYGAVFSLLIFFVLGMKCDGSMILKIRAIPKTISVLTLLLGWIPAYCFPYAIHSIRLNYSDEGFSNIEGVLWRCCFYCIAIVMGIAVINLVPCKKGVLSKIGQSAILVYAGSTFLSPSLYVLINNYLNLSQNEILNFIGMVIFSLCVVFVCSRDIFDRIYSYIIDKILNIIFKQ